MKKRRCQKCSALGHYTKTCTKKIKRSKIRRYSTGSVTKSRQGRSFFGSGTRWTVLYHGGQTRDTKHDKSWSIKIIKKGAGWAVITRHGRRTGEKNETVRKSMSKANAISLANSLLRSKLEKGYHIVGGNR